MVFLSPTFLSSSINLERLHSIYTGDSLQMWYHVYFFGQLLANGIKSFDLVSLTVLILIAEAGVMLFLKHIRFYFNLLNIFICSVIAVLESFILVQVFSLSRNLACFGWKNNKNNEIDACFCSAYISVICCCQTSSILELAY